MPCREIINVYCSGPEIRAPCDFPSLKQRGTNVRGHLSGYVFYTFCLRFLLLVYYKIELYTEVFVDFV